MTRFTISVLACLTCAAWAMGQMSAADAMRKMAEAEGRPATPTTAASTTEASPAPAKPDLSAMSQDDLRTLAESLLNRVADLEAQLSTLQAQADESQAAADAAAVTSSSHGRWMIRVSANEAPNVEQLQMELDKEKQRLGTGGTISSTSRSYGSFDSGGVVYRSETVEGINGQLASLRRQLADMSGSKTYTYDATGRRNYEKRYSSEELAQIRKQIRDLERDRRVAMNNISELEEQIQSAKTSRSITGMNEEGQPVVISARGEFFAMGKTLQAGQAYWITGKGRKVGQIFRIQMTGSEPASAQAQP